MVFPVMNLKTRIKESGFDKEDTINNLVRKARKIESGLGDVMLMSSGKLKKGFNSNLITREGSFNISRIDTDYFYWAGSKASDAYFVNEKGEVFLGHQLHEQINILEFYSPHFDYSFKPAGHHSFAEMYFHPLFTLGGLYKKNKIKQKIGIFKPKENIEGKIKFLESFLDYEDKMKFKPKDTIVKNPKLRLKLLEQHYRNHVDFCAMCIR